MTAFRTTGVVQVRAATLPYDRAGVLAGRPDPAAGDERAELTGILSAVTADPVVREALETSSASLAALLRRVEDGAAVGIGQLRRGTYAACRYLLRMTGRPTPFGLLAGVAIGRFGDRARVALGGAHGKGVRPDGDWLSTLVSELETRPEILRGLRVCANDLCYERGGRIVVPYTAADRGTDPRTSEKTVRATPPVRLALDAARRPVAAADLAARIAEAYPSAGTARAETLLAQLVGHGVLCTELAPPPHRTDPLAHVLALLERTPAAETGPLCELAKLLDEYAGTALGSGRAAWSAANAAARAVHATDRTPVHVDLRFAAGVTLPDIVAREAEAAADALLRLAPPRGSAPHLAEYHAAFLDTYGFATAVPVKEVLDPERGLGPPAGYRLPADGRLRDPEPVTDRARDDRLGELAQWAAGPVRLDDALIAELAGDAQAPPPPPTAELTFQLLADSAPAIERGDFRLLCAPAFGPLAGAILGRFAYLFPDPAGALADAMALESYPAEPVQLAFQPAGGRLSNVTRVPTVAGRTMTIGGFDERAGDGGLSLDDIGIVAEPDRLGLVSLRDHRRITALAPHMLDRARKAPNAARLLGEIAADGVGRPGPWSWGAAACLPRLPRVQYGRTVLALARWRPPARLVAAAREPARWDRELDRWREESAVPGAVQARIGDHSLDLDLADPLHRRLLADELRRNPDLVVTETVHGGGARYGWLGGHANEIVVPLAARSPRPAERHAVTTGGAREAVPPGGEWLYAKLYCGPARQEEILREHLPGLLAAASGLADRWFYVRYRDPDPHLRIRFHGEPDALNRELLPRLHAFAAELRAEGLARTLDLGTYEPETARYGGPAALAAAEDAFRADSEAAIAQLGLRAAGEPPAEVLAAVNFADLLRLLDPAWPHWYDDLAVEHYDGMHHHVRQAVALTDALFTGADDDAPAALRAASRDRAEAVRRYAEALPVTPERHRSAVGSLLHMHHNRLLGPDRESEARAHAVTSRVAAAHRGRAKARRR